MARVRKIMRHPDGKNYYLVDANFLVNKFIPARLYNNLLGDKFAREKTRVENSMKWWDEIDRQIKKGKGKIYIPDICIAESFKVLAKKFYEDKLFKSPVDFNNARNKMSSYITTSVRRLKSAKRKIDVHDVSTCRDIIIAVDRFFEMFFKKQKNAQIADLILLATAKYLMDFYDIPKDGLHIITLDNALWEGSKTINEIPNAYNPNKQDDSVQRIFTDR
ncbi:MAG: hypothetical protein AABZ65_04210 [Candidatus Omnitrophota bacterium]